MNKVTATYTDSKGVTGHVTIVEVNSSGRDNYIVYIDASGDLKRDTISAITSAGYPVTIGTGAVAP